MCDAEPVNGIGKQTRIAKVCHEANKAFCEGMGDYSQPSWDEAPRWQRESAYIGVKHKLDNPESTPEDSHKCWMATKLADGWKWGEVKDPEKKEHPCMVPYEKLPREQQAKDHLFTAIVDALRNI